MWKSVWYYILHNLIFHSKWPAAETLCKIASNVSSASASKKKIGFLMQQSISLSSLSPLPPLCFSWENYDICVTSAMERAVKERRRVGDAQERYMITSDSTHIWHLSQNLWFFLALLLCHGFFVCRLLPSHHVISTSLFVVLSLPLQVVGFTHLPWKSGKVSALNFHASSPAQT